MKLDMCIFVSLLYTFILSIDWLRPQLIGIFLKYNLKELKSHILNTTGNVTPEVW